MLKVKNGLGLVCLLCGEKESSRFEVKINQEKNDENIIIWKVIERGRKIISFPLLQYGQCMLLMASFNNIANSFVLARSGVSSTRIFPLTYRSARKKFSRTDIRKLAITYSASSAELKEQLHKNRLPE